MKLHIRQAFIADIPLIREITMQVWPQTYIPIIGAQQVSYMLDLFYSAGSLTKQMEESGHKFIIGYNEKDGLAFASYSEIGPETFKLHKLYILPNQQGKGVGRFMLNHIVADIKSNGAHSLLLNVNRHNHSAITFYEKTGFTHFRDEDIDIGGGYFMNDHVLRLSF